MSYLDTSDFDDPPTRRTGHVQGAPPGYPDAGAPDLPAGHRYGDGVSAQPLYGGHPGAHHPAGGHHAAHSAPSSPPYASPQGYGAPPIPGAPHPYNGGEVHPEHLYPGGATAPAVPPPPRPAGRLARGREERQAEAKARSTGRAGRNLPAAIAVGVALGLAVVVSLFVWRPAFLAVVALAVAVGIWEMVRAVRPTGANPPMLPLIAGGVLMVGFAWWGQADALTFGLILTVLVVMVWRLSDTSDNYGRDVTAATLIAVYVPFLAGFAALLARPTDGDLRVLVTLAGVVLSDTGGYAAGVFFGRHPMAPSVSPKKSWEGFAGSIVATAAGAALLLFFLFNVALWQGALFGVAVSIASVLGDLGESLLKRDLGVKDMSNLLPGHGGLMDRLDSIVFAAPTAYLLLSLLAPPV
jgi:phosphatidate cytidylyltransferase